jgi:hypothetical protein
MIDGLQILTTPTAHTLQRLDSALMWSMQADTKSKKNLDGTKRTILNNSLHLEQRTSTTAPKILFINGSIHKYKNNGLHNADRLPFDTLQQTIQHLVQDTTIDPQTSDLHGLEIGVNLRLSVPAKEVIKQIICYKNKPFNRFTTSDNLKGLSCEMSEYELKIYPKLAPSDTGEPIEVLRVELHIKKMRFIQDANICTLADLTDRTKIEPLKRYLLDAIDNVIFFDFAMNKKGLTQRERIYKERLSNPKFWQYASKMERLRAKGELAMLMQNHAKNYLKPTLKDAIIAEWSSLFIPSSTSKNAPQNVTFSPLEYIGQNVSIPKPKTNSDIKICPKKPTAKPTTPPVKRCKSCNRDISDQKETSYFCSETKHGKEARKCRNKASVKYRTFRNRIKKAVSQKLKIKVTTIKQTVTLQQSEINLNGFLWRLVESVEIVKPKAIKKPKSI